MLTIYSANAIKTTSRVVNGFLKFRHYWYETPFFLNKQDAIEHCERMLVIDPKLKGYHFTHISEQTVF